MSYYDQDEIIIYLKSLDFSVKEITKMLNMYGNRTKKILEYNNELPVLEHLVGNVDVKNIKLDNAGEPIINKRIINMLFSDNKIKEMLQEKYGFTPLVVKHPGLSSDKVQKRLQIKELIYY